MTTLVYPRVAEAPNAPQVPERIDFADLHALVASAPVYREVYRHRRELEYSEPCWRMLRIPEATVILHPNGEEELVERGYWLTMDLKDGVVRWFSERLGFFDYEWVLE